MLQSMQLQQVKQMQQEKQDTLQWFYKQAKEYELTGTAQRLWYWLFTQLSMAQPGRFYEISIRMLANELGVCIKSIERSRKALQQSGLLHYEVRGKSVYYRLLLPDVDNKERVVASATFCADSANPYNNDNIITNSKDYTACKQKQLHQPDILFNDKYEILLWDYLNKYKDNRFAEACCNHFIMVKEIYQHKGKKKLTEAGFYNIMNELEQLSGNDMTLKLAIMERSLRNR